MIKQLIVSPSPHIKGSDSIQKIMYGVIIAMVPALIMSYIYFGLRAVSVVAVSVAACVAFEALFQKLFFKEIKISDGSAILTGMILALNLPASIPYWQLVVGALVAIGVAKISFGGLGQNIFNPAIVGRVFMLIAYPVSMTSWPVNRALDIDGTTAATPLALLKEGIKAGEPVSSIMSSESISSGLDLFYGNVGGSLGEISAAAILLGGLYMLIRKIITWHIPVSIFATVLLFQGALWFSNPEAFGTPLFHLLTGGVMFGAIFMATDMVTSPMSGKGQIIFGIGIGVITIVIRNFGAYPEGISFAILFMNGVTPLINSYIKPKRFGGQKNG